LKWKISFLLAFVFKNAHIRLLADCYTRVATLRNVFKNKSGDRREESSIVLCLAVFLGGIL